MNEDERLERQARLRDKINEWNEICVRAMRTCLDMEVQAVLSGNVTEASMAMKEMKFWRSMII